MTLSHRHKTLLRVGLSLLLLGWLFSRIDLKQSWGVLLEVDLRFALTGLAIYVFYQFLQTLRWMWLLRPFRLEIGFWTLFRYQLAGIFYGLFLPSSFGGDIAKGLHLGFDYQQRMNSLSSVIMARALGLLGLWLFVLIQFVLFPGVFREQGLVWPLVGFSFVCALAVTLVLLWRPRPDHRRIRLPRGLGFLERGLDSLVASLEEYRKHPWHLLPALLLSIGIHFVSYSYDFVVGVSLGGAVALRYFLIFGPFIFLLTILPFFINGLGIRENGMVFLFARLEHVTDYWIFSVAILSYLMVVLLGLIGGLVLLLPGRRQHPRRNE